MPSVISSLPILTVGGPLAAVDTDLVIVPWFEDDEPGVVPGLDAATGGEIARATGSKEFVARLFDLWLTPIVQDDWRARRVALVGGGRSAAFTPEVARKLATAAGLAARQRRVPRASFVLRTDTPAQDVPALAQAIAEGLTLAELTSACIKRTMRRLEPSPRGRSSSRAMRVRRLRARPTRWRADAFWASAAIWRAAWRTSRVTR